MDFSCGEQGPLFVAVRGPLTAVASLVVEHGLEAHGLRSCGMWAQQLWLVGLAAPRHVGPSWTGA